MISKMWVYLFDNRTKKLMLLMIIFSFQAGSQYVLLVSRMQDKYKKVNVNYSVILMEQKSMLKKVLIEDNKLSYIRKFKKYRELKNDDYYGFISNLIKRARLNLQGIESSNGDQDFRVTVRGDFENFYRLLSLISNQPIVITRMLVQKDNLQKNLIILMNWKLL